MMTTNDGRPDSAQGRMKLWAAVFGGMLLVIVGGAGGMWITANSQEQRADGYGAVVGEQADVIEPLCKVAGSSVNRTDKKAREACANVSQGLPPVPIPTDVAPPQNGADGVGITYVRQVDRCFIEVGLSDRNGARFGPFCGLDGPVGLSGAAGEPGAPGPSGENGVPGEPGKDGADGKDGVDGRDGISIRDIQTNGCMIEITLTDDSVRTVGPFCGAPPGEYTEVRPDGSEKHCRRDGGADTAPRYVCSITGTTTTTTVEPTGELPIPTG